MAGQSLYTSSSVVNGQLVPSVRTNNYFSNAVGPVTQGLPATPAQSAGSGGGGPSSGGTSQVAAAAAANPMDLTKSPVPMLIIMFVAGYLMLRYIHYPY
jgi:hypothetical protein